MLALAVILGAFGAHGLQNRLDDYSRGVYEKAVLYHFLHAMGILVVAVLGRTGTFPGGGRRYCVLVSVRGHLTLFRQPVFAGGTGNACAGHDHAARRRRVHYRMAAAGVAAAAGALMARHIFVYGDSLTWGIVPNTRERFPFDVRWPGVMENKLHR